MTFSRISQRVRTRFKLGLETGSGAHTLLQLSSWADGRSSRAREEFVPSTFVQAASHLDAFIHKGMHKGVVV